jgi:putative peptidoglycan lipid II flippase
MSTIGMFFVRSHGYITRETKYSLRGSGPIFATFLRRLGLLIWLPILTLTTVITERMVSSHMGVVVVASTDFARLITDTGVLLLAVPVGLASLPSFATTPDEHVPAKIAKTIEPLLLLSFPVAALLAAFAVPIVDLLFGRGAFDQTAVDVTASILSGLTLGLWAQLTVYFVIKVLNARDRNVTSVLIMASAAVVTIGSRPYLVEWLGTFGLGLAPALGFTTAFIVGLIVVKSVRVFLLDLAVSLPALAVTGAVAVFVPELPTLIDILLLVGVIAVWVGNYLAFPRSRRVLIGLAQAIRVSRSKARETAKPEESSVV